MDYVAAVSNGLGYCEAVEKLMAVEAPPRAQLHPRDPHASCSASPATCLWLGTHAMDIGAMTPLFYAFREREVILKIFEEFCGARLTTTRCASAACSMNCTTGFEKKVLAVLRQFMAAKLDEYEELLTHNRIWRGAHQGRGFLNAADCNRARA